MISKSTSQTSTLPNAFSLAQPIQLLINKLNISSTHIASERITSLVPSVSSSQSHLFPLPTPPPEVPGGSDSKAPACNAGDPGLIPRSERSLEKEMATHSSTLAWKIPWMEESGGLQYIGLQRVRHDYATSLFFHFPLPYQLIST